MSQSEVVPSTLLCPECSGACEVVCGCGCPNCDHLDTCASCQGLGFDPAMVDLDRWRQATVELSQRLGYAYRDMKNRDGVLIGATGFGNNRSRRIFVTDYLLKSTK